MIDLYYWPTPNGHKITIMLEECELDYTIHPINIGAGNQFKPEFLAFSPNNRIPAIRDTKPNDGGDVVEIFESGAILLYLAQKTERFLPSDIRGYYKVMQWLMWQVGGLGPMAGQNHHFNLYAPETVPYAQERYTKETARLYRVLDTGLKNNNYIAGDYSIADMAIYAWIVPHQAQKQNLDDFPYLRDWFNRLNERPQVQAAYAKADTVHKVKPFTDEEKEVLFGKGQERT